MQFYQHHIGDFKKDTSFLTHKQRSQYLEMIWLYYDQEQPLPKDIDLIALKIQATAEEVDLLLKIFFDEEDDCYRHRRIDEELDAVYRKSESARKSAEARWNKASMRTQSDRNANGMLPITHNPIPNNIYSTEFIKFWEEWPNSKRKQAKALCYTIWKEQRLDNQLDLVLKHLRKARTSEQWTSGYEPMPATYLRQQRYLDDDSNFSRERKVL